MKGVNLAKPSISSSLQLEYKLNCTKTGWFSGIPLSGALDFVYDMAKCGIYLFSEVHLFSKVYLFFEEKEMECNGWNWATSAVGLAENLGGSRTHTSPRTSIGKFFWSQLYMLPVLNCTLCLHVQHMVFLLRNEESYQRNCKTDCGIFVYSFYIMLCLVHTYLLHLVSYFLVFTLCKRNILLTKLTRCPGNHDLET